jgi:hypothetical protein
MNGMIVKVVDPNSIEVYNFRKEIICTDENSNEDYLKYDIKNSRDIPEEVWKFSKLKWESLKLDKLYAVYVDDEIAAISGAKLYGRYLRVGMMYYVLKRFRKTVRSTLWANDGMLNTAINDFYQDIDYSFVSIYPHNTRLEAWCRALIRGKRFGQIGNGVEHLDLLKSYTMDSKPIIFHNVPQYILYRKETPDDISADIFLEQLSELINIKK